MVVEYFESLSLASPLSRLLGPRTVCVGRTSEGSAGLGSAIAMSGHVGAYTSDGRAARTAAAATFWFPPQLLPAPTAAGRLHASQHSPGTPGVGTLSHSTPGMRPSQVPVGVVRVPPLVQHKPATISPSERDAGDVADAVPGIAHRAPTGFARTTVQRKFSECEHEKKRLRAKTAPSRTAASTDARRWESRVLDVVGRGGGQPLTPHMRADMEAEFGADFSDVRIHASTAAATSAAAVSAEAYTLGNEIVFGQGFFAPESPEGKHRLAHELAHVQQQRKVPVSVSDGGLAVSDPSDSLEQEAEAAASRALAGPRRTPRDPSSAHEHRAEAVARGNESSSGVRRGATPGVVYRQHQAPGPVSVRSPVFEETVTQLSDIAAGLTGRALTTAEQTIAANVFGASIDLDRVRLIPTHLLEYRTVGNNIRVPHDFTIADEYMRQTLVHELTHVWQYQHGGTSYLSHSVQTQIVGALRGNRNFAYNYELKPGLSFFDFTPEQQASIVENYFAMRRDQAKIASAMAAAGEYASNHQGPDGFPKILSPAQRTAEISRELPAHELAIAQMRAALPDAERTIMLQRAAEVMQTPGSDVFRDPTREITPVKPVLEIRF